MKKIIFLSIMFGFFVYFITNPAEAFTASQDGILLWFYQVLPTLLPFCILSGVLICSHFFEALNRFVKRHKIPTGAISAAEWFVIVCGFCFGFPIGSKLSADLYQRGFLTEKRAQILCGFTNNMSPVFISTFVCRNVLNRPDFILPLFVILYGPALLSGIVLLSYDARKNPLSPADGPGNVEKNTVSRFKLDIQIIDTGILNSFLTLVKLCGYIVLFSLAAGMVKNMAFLPLQIKTVTIGLSEVTNGIANLKAAALPSKTCFALSVLFLSTGGISGIAQTGSVIHPARLSLGKYLWYRFLLLGISTLLTMGYLYFSPLPPRWQW